MMNLFKHKITVEISGIEEKERAAMFLFNHIHIGRLNYSKEDLEKFFPEFRTAKITVIQDDFPEWLG